MNTDKTIIEPVVGTHGPYVRANFNAKTQRTRRAAEKISLCESLRLCVEKFMPAEIRVYLCLSVVEKFQCVAAGLTT
jgi:hypothetical protein